VGAELRRKRRKKMDNMRIDAEDSEIIIHVDDGSIDLYPNKKEICIEFRKNDSVYTVRIFNAANVNVVQWDKGEAPNE
jgi:hypothetical protein